MHRRATLLIAATALIGGLSACDTTEPYAAKVNGEVITMSDFRDDIEVLAAGFAEQDPTATDGASVNGDLARGYLSTQILLQLIEAEVAVREIDLDALSQAQNDEASQLIGSIAVGSTRRPSLQASRNERVEWVIRMILGRNQSVKYTAYNPTSTTTKLMRMYSFLLMLAGGAWSASLP